MRHRSLIVLTAVLCAVVSLSTVAAQETEAEADELRVVHVGNSHSHPLYLMEYLAADLGRRQTVGRINILGAPLHWLWDHPDNSGWPRVLDAENHWDIITLLSWNRSDPEYAVKFAAEAFKGNPDCELLIYTIWPGAGQSWDDPPAFRREEHSESVAAALKTAFPDKPQPRVIPSSLLMCELGRMADRGLVPGLPNRFALLSDGGHLSKEGMYAVNVLVSAMMYRESPLEYPAAFGRRDARGELRGGWYDSLDIDEETARVIRETARDILLTYPPAGMATQLVIADRSLPTALAGRAYETRLNALNAGEDATYALVDGTLPEGLSLAADGAIRGTAEQAGEFPVTIAISDAGERFERALELRVDADVPPRIGEISLPSIGLDERAFQELEAEGGVRPFHWEVTEGRMPHGIELSPAGILEGTSGEAGEFRFTVRMTDSHPDGPRAATRVLSWQIGPPSPQTLQVREVHVPDGTDRNDVIRVDGQTDEEIWDIAQPIANAVGGEPSAEAAFDVFWLSEQRGRRRNNLGLYLGVRVKHGPEGPTPADAVHIFLDGRHSREAIYNQDDMHLVVPREGRPHFPHAHTPSWFMNAAVAETDDGYTVEVELRSHFFQGGGITVPFGAGAVYGFDVAVEEGRGDDVSRLTWRGDETIDHDTSSFGTIWLVE